MRPRVVMITFYVRTDWSLFALRERFKHGTMMVDRLVSLLAGRVIQVEVIPEGKGIIWRRAAKKGIVQ